MYFNDEDELLLTELDDCYTCLKFEKCPLILALLMEAVELIDNQINVAGCEFHEKNPLSIVRDNDKIEEKDFTDNLIQLFKGTDKED